MSINELALAAGFTTTGLRWQFPTVEAARYNLRRYEKLIAHWAAMMGAESAEVFGGNEQFPVTPRLSNIEPEITPIAAVPQFDGDDDLLIAQQWLNRPLLDVLIEMRANPGIAALVSWATQKQVVLTQACAQIPIGQQLADCLRYSRADYWVKAHLDAFMRECRQQLRDDGSNSIEFKYLTFDPTTGDDWIEIVGRYRMVDAGKLGQFQLGQNVSFERVAAPAAR
jgi:hypothetical protein